MTNQMKKSFYFFVKPLLSKQKKSFFLRIKLKI